MFAYPCPACHQRLLAPAGRGGQRSICPKCLTPLTVPTPEEVAAGPFAPVAAQAHAHDPAPADDFSPAIDFPPNDSFDPSDSLAGPRVDAELETLSPVNTLPPVDLTATVPVLDLPVELTQTPPPVAGLAPAPVPTAAGPKPLPPTKRRQPSGDDGRVVLAPTGLFAVDVAAELSAAISMRMAPPPLPAADRTVPVVGWFAGTAVGAAAWALGVWASAAWLPYVALVGGGMALFAVLWRAYLSGQRSWAKGVAALLPPLCVLNLFRKAEGHGLRPLLFALTGAALCGLFAAGPAARKWVSDHLEPTPEAKAEPEPTKQPVSLAGLHSHNKADREAARAAAVQAGAAAEPALRELLSAAEESKVLLACELLEQIGTADTLPALREQADNLTRSRSVRFEATAALEAIRKRVK